MQNADPDVDADTHVDADIDPYPDADIFANPMHIQMQVLDTDPYCDKLKLCFQHIIYCLVLF